MCFYLVFGMCIKFCTFWKIMSLAALVFSIFFRCDRRVYLNALKGPTSHLQKSPFILLCRHSDLSWVGKSHFYCHMRPKEISLTRWLGISKVCQSSFGIKQIIYRYQFKCCYLKNKKLFAVFLSNFWNVH